MKSQKWAADLAAWAIPDEILAQAPTSPWIHPVELFEVAPDQEFAINRSAQLALAALPAGGSVLDIGSGGGKASMELIPPAGLVIGVDHQKGMLTKFAEAASVRNAEHLEVLGDWPDIAAETPIADVAVAHHVIYNVADLESFARAATLHARNRVVLEAPTEHPLAHLAWLWRHFWGLERPNGPLASDALDVLQEAGIDAHIEYFSGTARKSLPLEKQVEFTRIRLCLPATRDAEIAELLANRIEEPRQLAAIWWDTK